MEKISNGRKMSSLPQPHIALNIGVNASGGTATIPAPGAGLALQVLGYNITTVQYANGVVTDSPYLTFATSGVVAWWGPMLQPTANKELCHYMSGIVVQGGENEALTLLNGTVSAGTANAVRALVYYRKVVV